MKLSTAAAVMLGVTVAHAAAEQRYDKRLEAAAIGIVAKKMGDLRRGFDTGQSPDFVAPIDRSRPTHLSAKIVSDEDEHASAEAPAQTSFVSF